MDYIYRKKASATGVCIGAVVGLVVITPACGYVTIGAGFCMGVIGAVVCFIAQINFKSTGIDDTLDVFPCHGIGGTLGIFLTGCFANNEVYSDILNGLFYGGAELFWKHIVAICGIITYVCVAS